MAVVKHWTKGPDGVVNSSTGLLLKPDLSSSTVQVFFESVEHFLFEFDFAPPKDERDLLPEILDACIHSLTVATVFVQNLKILLDKHGKNPMYKCTKCNAIRQCSEDAFEHFSETHTSG